MIDIEILDIIKVLQATKSEINNVEAKAAKDGCPKKLYDTISVFSNTSGGIIIFGVNEQDSFQICGVYDVSDLQKKVTEQCNQMHPIVRPVFSTVIQDNKAVVVAEIPESPFHDRPVYYSGAGIQKGSYTRVGDSDIRMTDAEIYSLMAFRNNILDELCIVQRADMQDLDVEKMDEFLSIQTKKKPNFAKLGRDKMLQDIGIIGLDSERILRPTTAGLLCFGVYPQSFFPQLMVTCIAVPGYEIGEVGGLEERFIDNKKIEGTIPEMIEDTIAFIIKNMKVKTIISGETGKRQDMAEYPIKAIREGILNALIHRDYSKYSEGIYVQVRMYKDRIEIQNPGGLFGRISIDLLGKEKNYDSRNPNIIRILEDMEIVENRGSGIPTMIDEMVQYGLKNPVFESTRGDFIVTLCCTDEQVTPQDENKSRILVFCNIPRSKKEIAEFIGIKDLKYFDEAYLSKLLDNGLIKMTIPDKPRSRNQKYISINNKTDIK